MIEIKDVSKQFGRTRAVDHVSFSVKEENVFGLIGTNGAGKSTMLRMLAGVLKPDAGLVLIDGMQVYDNVNAKKMFFFIGDEPYFFPMQRPETWKNTTAVSLRHSVESPIICIWRTSVWTAEGK